VLLIGFIDREAIGTTYARSADDSIGHIGAMWIGPRHRRRGLGQQLLRAGIDWHCERRRRLRLWVTEGNAPAATLYCSNGFTLTGAREQLREGKALYRPLMQKNLLDEFGITIEPPHHVIGRTGR
jgi:ribosomal protein S18 acetylase RimI-like enzyme